MMITVRGMMNGHLEPLDRAEHGDGWRDHSVAVEERSARQAEHHEDVQARTRHRPFPPLQLRLVLVDHQGKKGEDPPLPLVVGAHDEREVLEDDDQRERVEDERQDAQHVVVRRRDSVGEGEALFHRVEGRRADVAVHDAQRA
jgi:hypothetical protein